MPHWVVVLFYVVYSIWVILNAQLAQQIIRITCDKTGHENWHIKVRFLWQGNSPDFHHISHKERGLFYWCMKDEFSESVISSFVHEGLRLMVRLWQPAFFRDSNLILPCEKKNPSCWVGTRMYKSFFINSVLSCADSCLTMINWSYCHAHKTQLQAWNSSSFLFWIPAFKKKRNPPKRERNQNEKASKRTAIRGSLAANDWRNGRFCKRLEVNLKLTTFAAFLFRRRDVQDLRSGLSATWWPKSHYKVKQCESSTKLKEGVRKKLGLVRQKARRWHLDVLQHYDAQ